MSYNTVKTAHNEYSNNTVYLFKVLLPVVSKIACFRTIVGFCHI